MNNLNHDKIRNKMLNSEELNEYLEKLGSKWKIDNENAKLFRKFNFLDFKQVLEFTNLVGGLLNDLNRKPELKLSYNKVEIHVNQSDKRLYQKDFEFAEEINNKYYGYMKMIENYM
ncbi:MAG: 4a-hydroxytetrahydrobiopterin dehydratase [Candidatus Heimdallarchaeota archaeon]|nr:4a-hydroxytetrahydrobiopterin dehydratase [Candidatus Heimdallarchaeota archaeon]MDH5645551.1 4a-hydroxytetrahydrobiopterin dehydratase [Candidatus Heimdallarchaeota archaeon]